MRAIYVQLPADANDRLRELAQRDMRDPREQAAWLILDGLRRAAQSERRPRTLASAAER